MPTKNLLLVGKQIPLKKFRRNFVKIFVDQCRSVEGDPRNPINDVGNFVTPADGFCGALKMCPAWLGMKTKLKL